MGCTASRIDFETTLLYFQLMGAVIIHSLNTFTSESVRIEFNNIYFIYSYNKLFCTTSLQTIDTIYRNKSLLFYFNTMNIHSRRQNPNVYARIWNSENGPQKELRFDLMFLNEDERKYAHKLLQKSVGSVGYSLPPLTTDGKVMILVDADSLISIRKKTELLMPNIVIWNDFSCT